MIVPLVAFMLGEEWVFYACVFMGIQTIFFWTHCKNVLSHEKGFNLKKIFTNINIITIIAAIVLFFAKIRLSGNYNRYVKFCRGNGGTGKYVCNRNADGRNEYQKGSDE